MAKRKRRREPAVESPPEGQRQPKGWRKFEWKLPPGDSYSSADADAIDSHRIAELISYLPKGCRIHLVEKMVWFELPKSGWSLFGRRGKADRFVTDQETFDEFLQRMRQVVPGLAVGWQRGILGSRQFELLLLELLHRPDPEAATVATETVSPPVEDPEPSATTSPESAAATVTPPVLAVADGDIARPQKHRRPLTDYKRSPKATPPEAQGSKYEELGRFDQPERSTQDAWTHPVVAADGRLFLRDQDILLCYDLKR